MAESMQYQDDTGYQCPQKVSIEEALEKDKDDTALTKWKQQLLGNNLNVKNDKHVIFNKLMIKLLKHNNKILSFDFEDIKAKTKVKEPLFSIKGGDEFCIGFEYNVYNDVVMGLRTVMKVSKSIITIARDQLMIGCYAPNATPYQYFSPETVTSAKGIARGRYKVHCVFGDDDEGDSCYGSLTFYFNLTKDDQNENQ